MINTTDLLIEEGRKLAQKIKIPMGYEWAGENIDCPKCHGEAVYGTWENNDEGNFSGEFLCTDCGYSWSKI